MDGRNLFGLYKNVCNLPLQIMIWMKSNNHYWNFINIMKGMNKYYVYIIICIIY